jgi:membrane-bound ClpP family serine protease
MDDNKNGFAVASLVLGIVAVCCCCFSGLSLVLAVLAIVFAVLSRKNPAKKGLGTAGLVLGIIAAVIAIVSIIISGTDWYEAYMTEYLTDILGDDYAKPLS